MANTYLHDTFSGTPDAALAGQQASPVNNGTDAWEDGGRDYIGAMKYIAGGGVTSSQIGSNGYATQQYELTGASTDQTVTLGFLSNVAGGLCQFISHRNPGTPHGFTFAFDFAKQAWSIGQNDTAGADHAVASGSVPLAHDGTAHTLVYSLIGTQLTATLDNQPLGAGSFPVQPMTGTQLWLFQNGGAIGDVTYKEIQVDQVTATLSGPSAGQLGAASANFSVAVPGQAPSGGLPITLASDNGGTFGGPNVSGDTLTIPAGATSATFTYTPSSSGTSNLSISSPGLATANSPLAYTASGTTTNTPANGTITVVATTVPAGQAGQPIQVTLDQVAPAGGTAIDFAVTDPATGADFAGSFSVLGPSGSFGGSTLTIPAGVASVPIRFSPAAAGAFRLTPTSSGIAFNPAHSDFAAVAVSITLSQTSLVVGGTGQAGATGLDAGKAPSWSTTNPNVLAIDAATGAYTALATGRQAVVLGGYVGGSPYEFDGAPIAISATGASSITAVAVSPATATVQYGSTQRFAATVSGAGNFDPSANWTATAGSVDASGLFTAPGGSSTDQTVMVRATSAQDATKSGSAVVTVPAATTTTPPPATGPSQLSAYYPVPTTASIYFVVFRDADLQAWKSAAFEPPAAADWPAYAIAGADAAGVCLYLAPMPATIPAGYVTVFAYARPGAEPAPTDTLVGRDAGLYWTGTAFLEGPGGGGTGGGIGQAALDAAVAQIVAEIPYFPRASVVQGATAGTITLDQADLNGVPLVGMRLGIYSGKGKNQERDITSVDAGGVAPISPPWDVVPEADPDADTSTYYLYQPEIRQVGGVLPGQTNGRVIADIRAMAIGKARDTPSAPDGIRSVTFEDPDGSDAVVVSHDAAGNRISSASLKAR